MALIPKIILSTLLFIVLFYGTLALMPSKSIEPMDDDTLRSYALSHGLSGVPLSYEKLLEVVDNPQNRLSAKKIKLGERLFFDTILSSDRTISCSSCHIVDQGGDDNLPTAVGVNGQKNPKHLNSPTVLNAALAKAQFWDGRAETVEEQAAGPMQAPFEMNITQEEAIKRLKNDPGYLKAFEEVFKDGVTFKNIQNAIGAYERTLLTYGAYDRFLEGDNDAMNEAAKRGFNLFIQKGCKGCHTGMSVGGQSLQQFPLRRVFFDLFKSEPFPFENVGGFLGKDGKKRFRVPILRNITKTAPYFHNGVVKDLKEAIRIMSKYQIGDEFNERQIEDMVEFFKTLEGEPVSYDIGR